MGDRRYTSWSDEASEFSDNIFGMLSLKRLSDAFDEAKKQVVEQYLSTGKSRSDEGFISGVIVRSVSSHSPHTSTVK